METAQPELSIRGQCASRGSYSGPARLVRDDASLLDVQPGDILVLRTPLPGLTRVLALAGAVVSEQGGVLSNLATVSRELRVPCVLGASGVVDAVHDGDWVLVDAGDGIVSVLARHPLAPCAATSTA